jgi:hypothetical protein
MVRPSVYLQGFYERISSYWLPIKTAVDDCILPMRARRPLSEDGEFG